MNKINLQIAIGLMLLSTPAFASECRNKMSISQFESAKANNGLGLEMEPSCNEKEECICFDKATEWAASNLVDVFGDDTDRPIIERSDEETCVVEVDETKLPDLDPKIEAEARAVILDEAAQKELEAKESECHKKATTKQCKSGSMPGWEFDSDKQVYTYYCSKLLGFEQKFVYREVQPDKAKEKEISDNAKAKEAAEAAEKATRKTKLASFESIDWTTINTLPKAIAVMKDMAQVLKALKDK
jgi:hypothetical protein